MRRRNLITWSALVASSICVAWVLLQSRPVGVLLHCPLRNLTGIPCPTCGGTHTLRALLHLDLATAFASNPLLALGIILFGLSGIAALAVLPWAGRLRLPPGLGGKGIASLVIALVVLNWIYLLFYLD